MGRRVQPGRAQDAAASSARDRGCACLHLPAGLCPRPGRQGPPFTPLAGLCPSQAGRSLPSPRWLAFVLCQADRAFLSPHWLGFALSQVGTASPITPLARLCPPPDQRRCLIGWAMPSAMPMQHPFPLRLGPAVGASGVARTCPAAQCSPEPGCCREANPSLPPRHDKAQPALPSPPWHRRAAAGLFPHGAETLGQEGERPCRAPRGGRLARALDG